MSGKIEHQLASKRSLKLSELQRCKEAAYSTARPNVQREPLSAWQDKNIVMAKEQSFTFRYVKLCYMTLGKQSKHGQHC